MTGRYEVRSYLQFPAQHHAPSLAQSDYCVVPTRRSDIYKNLFPESKLEFLPYFTSVHTQHYYIFI